MADQSHSDVQGGLTDEEKRTNVIRLAFGGSAERFEDFCRTIRQDIPDGTAVVLRGSAVTGRRWKDGAAFDVDAWHKPRVSRHAFLEIAPATTTWRIFGVHLSAVHAAWTERRRVFELRALLRAIAAHQHGPHALVGDFNTVAPGDLLDIRKLPHRLRALVWLSGGRIRWKTVATVLAAGYVDAFRRLHPTDPGYTLPTPDPHVRLDYAFVAGGVIQHVHACDVITTQESAAASDHFPLLLDVGE